jgi:CRP/FNR family transcriptional regulator, cyclic AMP receptor protein
MSWLVDTVAPAERARVESVLASCSVLSLPRGASLGARRFEGVELLLIEDGTVFVSAGNQSSARRIVVGLTGPDSVLVAPVGDERLEALADARLTLIPASAQRRLLELTAAAAVIVGALGTGIHDCRESLAQLGCRRHSDRLRQKLTQLARNYGKVGMEGLVLDLPLTHELLAEMVGATRETVTRALAQLAEDGFIRHERGRYLVAGSPDAIAR